METRSTPPKNPYLSQYKSNISAQQKAIRQRLGNPDGSIEVNIDNNDPHNIPSIDDENDAIHQERETTKYKSRYSYFDNDAEESLQFFKKNLLPNSSNLTTVPMTPEVKKSSSNLFDERPSFLSSTVKSDSARSRAPIGAFESSALDDDYKRPLTSSYTTRPVPFKQTAFGETRLERQPVLAEPSASSRRPSKSSSRTSLEQIQPVETELSHQGARARSSGRQRGGSGSRQPSSEPVPVRADVLAEKPTRPPRQQMGATARPVSPIMSESPALSTDTFSRKPLYNSLLRAHDSIRLKVNRPKVRPKSEAHVDDTEVDDSIQLAEMASSPSLNERPVDVKQRRGSKKKSKKKSADKDDQEQVDEGEKVPVRNFSEVRIVKVVRSEDERCLGVTVRADDGNIVVARILAGSLADKQGALQVGDVILAVNGREVYTPEQLQEQLRRTIQEDTVLMKIVPSFREELPTLCIYLRALFNYDANEDSLLPCKEVGVSFNQGDILEVVNQEDPNWWQARRVDSENLQTGLIPSQQLEERRRAFVIPDYDLATRTSICGTKVSRKSKKKEIYNIGQNCDFDRAELQLYEEVCRTPAFERRTLVLIGANGVGKQAFKARLVAMDPERFGTPLPHTSRLPREGEEDGIHYHFVTREKMEEDIIEGKYLEYGEYDGALYGTKLDSVREIIGSGKVCVLDCSPTCLKILKTSDYLPFVAFIAAPTLDQLRYMHEWNRGNKTYATFDRALSRQSRRAKTLQDFAFDFFEDEDLQVTVEESARLFRVYENYFDIVLVNNHFERTFEQLREAIDALSMAPQWIPISWIYGTT